MSLQWMDFPSGSAGIYGLTGESYMDDGTPWVNTGWDGSGTGRVLIEDPDPLVSGVVLIPSKSGASGDPWTLTTRMALPSPTTTPGVSFRVWFGAFPGVDTKRNQIQFRTTGNNDGYGLRYSINGGIQVIKGNTVLDEIVVPVLVRGAWQHLSFTVDTVSGEWSLEREGVPLLSGTDGAPLGSAAFFLSFASQTSEGAGEWRSSYYKDLLVWDQSGSTNNTHPGPVSVYCLRPNADVSSGWARSSGASDYELLDEVPPDDAGYIYADATLPAPSIMGLETLPPDVVSVRGVMSVVRARKTDGGDGSLQVSLSPNAGVDWDDGANRAITTAFSYWTDISELSPDTASPWTPIEINNTEFKLNRTV